uniref:Uncharacterized protein n=1 Tax=viral metagenome TaxID=1070528 RepID=A0A6C0K5P4_9ZZZZ
MSPQIKKYLNPETHRWVRQGGAVYNDLVHRGVLKPQAPYKMMPSYKPPTEDSYRVPENFANYPVDHSNISWGQNKPDSVGQRRELFNQCGESCFLIPDPNNLKFPICNKTMPCTYNCRGLRAAKSRAGEWKYKKVLQRAHQLSDRFEC